MTDQTPPAAPVEGREDAALLLATFAELYRHEIGAEEDVHRALPFFGTALGIVVGALAYAAGRLPRWPDVATPGGRVAFWLASALLGLAVLEAGCVLLLLSRAMARRNYRRIGPVAVLRAKAGQGGDLQRALLDSYTEITPFNRELNQRRQRFRALASSHLIRSLIWALGATTVIFVADKLGYFTGPGL
jgi:hypothetical protein